MLSTSRPTFTWGGRDESGRHEGQGPPHVRLPSLWRQTLPRSQVWG